MDVYNVASQYAEFIDRQRQTLRQAKMRQGQRPQDRKSREEAYAKFMLGLTLKKDRGRQHIIHSSFLPTAYPPCVAPTRELRRVLIKDLQLETHHRGRYILLRSITPPSRMTAIMALMEDESFDVVMLQLYQQEDENIRPAADIVSVGTILLVKEPYFKVMADGEYGLRVDHICDAIQINMDDTRIPAVWWPTPTETERSAQSLKIKGNQAMGEGRFYDAIKHYTCALRQPATADETEIIKRNRSLAFLKTKQFDAALSDTGFPNLTSNPTEKGLFRAAEALYYLERFSDCCEILELLRAKFPHNNQAVTVLDRARRRLFEQRTGTYDFKQLQATVKKLRPPHLDHATYIGPVEIKQTESKGRGLFVTEAVKAGELLLCEKAFSHAYANEGDEAGSKVTLLMNPETNQGFMGAQADLIKQIVQKLSRNPSVAQRFTALYHGNYQSVSSTSPDGQPIVDTFLVDRVITFNVFGCPVSSLIQHKDWQTKRTKGQEAHHSCGIWTQASYINHSCTSTAHRAFIGDMMIVRASRDLDPGTEITFWYHSPDGTNPKKMKEKHKHWGFVCDCAICLDARTTEPVIVSERRKLLQSIKRVFDSSTPHVTQTGEIERLLQTLDGTYVQPAHKVPRLLLWDPQLALAHFYLAQNNVVKSLESVGKVLKSLGFIIVGADCSPTKFAVIEWGLMVNSLVEAFLHARASFAEMGAIGNAEEAEKYAKIAYKVVVGEDTSFDATYR